MCALGLQVWRAPRDGAYERFSEEATPDLRGGRRGETRGGRKMKKYQEREGKVKKGKEEGLDAIGAPPIVP